MAQKRVYMDAEMEMLPICHPSHPIQVLYTPERGGDRIRIKCRECYRVFFNVKLPKEEGKNG